jgi:purine-cytosine permease-like protein
MLINVEDPLRNLILNCSLIAVVLMTFMAIVPWATFGAKRIRRLSIWLPIPTLAVALIYEMAMPSRYDIRLDLVLLVPAYSLVLLATLIRVLARRRARRKHGVGRAV